MDIAAHQIASELAVVVAWHIERRASCQRGDRDRPDRDAAWPTVVEVAEKSQRPAGRMAGDIAVKLIAKAVQEIPQLIDTAVDIADDVVGWGR